MPGKLNNDYDPNSLPDLLPIYYKRIFPHIPYYKWLSYGGIPKTYFSHREFSFTLKDDVYIRYQSFTTQEDLEKEIQKRCPYKIDIGAVFSHKPKDHKTVKAAAFQAQEKELVFDIDMTDYDDVRNCCSGADICPRCWPLMTIAIKIIDRALEDDFGFNHRLWIYSGRRGVHCWVCDEGARKLSQQARSAIAEYLSVVKGGESQIKKVSLPESEAQTHPSIQHALSIVKHYFEEYAVQKQDFLEGDERLDKILALIPDEEFKSILQDDIASLGTNTKKRWDIIKARLGKSQNKKLNKCVGEIMLQMVYPRLDVNVSKGVNHLLKSPFCVHPKTGRVCVPMDATNIENFDPFKVPTISELCDELNSIDKTDPDSKKSKDYNKTSLGKYMSVFEIFLHDLENSWKGKKIQQSDATMEF